MGVCDAKRLTRNGKRCAEKALGKGVEETVLLGMRDEQEIAFTLDATNDTIVTAIALKTGEKLYAYQGKNLSNDPSVTMAVSDFEKTLGQTLVMMIFSNSPAMKKELEAMFERTDLIAIPKRKAGDYEIFGAETGMSVTAFDYKPNDANKGAFVVTLTAPDETRLPKTLRHVTATLDDTKAYLATLTAADV